MYLFIIFLFLLRDNFVLFVCNISFLNVGGVSEKNLFVVYLFKNDCLGFLRLFVGEDLILVLIYFLNCLIGIVVILFKFF